MTVKELLDAAQGYAPRPVDVPAAVARFLASLPAGCTEAEARALVEDDRALYRWNAATLRAVRLAVRERFGVPRIQVRR